MLVVAHAGHWAIDLLYVAPVLGFLLWLGRTHYRERRREPSGRR